MGSLLTIFLAVTAISMACYAVLAYYILGGDSDINGMLCVPLLTIFLAVTAISMACNAFLAYYILGGDSDINGMQCVPCLLYSWRCKRYQWHAMRSLLTIFLAVTAISMACYAFLAYYILGGDSDINGMLCVPCLLYSWR